MPMTVVEPDRVHSYVNPGVLLQSPVTALSVCPNVAVPEMVGVGAVENVAATTAGVAALVLLSVVNPDFVAVTVTVTVVPISAAVRV